MPKRKYSVGRENLKGLKQKRSKSNEDTAPTSQKQNFPINANSGVKKRKSEMVSNLKSEARKGKFTLKDPPIVIEEDWSDICDVRDDSSKIQDENRSYENTTTDSPNDETESSYKLSDNNDDDEIDDNDGDIEERTINSKCDVSDCNEECSIDEPQALCIGQPIMYFNPTDAVWQFELCQKLNVPFIEEMEYIGRGNELSDNENDFNRAKIIGDGNCFVRALSEVITGVEEYHPFVRQKLVNYEIEFKDELVQFLWQNQTFEEHLEYFSQDTKEGHDLDVFAAASLLETDIYVYQPYNNKFTWQAYSANMVNQNITAKNGSIYLKNTNGDHFDLVYAMNPLNVQQSVERVSRPKKRINEKANIKQKRRRDAQRRKNETPDQREARLSEQSSRQNNLRNQETPDKTTARLSNDKKHHHNLRKQETPDKTKARLSEQTSRQYKLRIRETFDKYTHRMYKQRDISAKNRQENKSEEKLVEQLIKNVRDKTTASFICTSCLRYHSRGNVVQVNIKKSVDEQRKKINEGKKQRKIKTDWKHYETHLIMNDSQDGTEPVTVSSDGKYYICNSCNRALLDNRVPLSNEKVHQFRVQDLPDEFKTSDMKLNNCEAHLLKLIIPFIRIAHIPRSSDFKVLGPVINVEADVSDTFDKILPINQDLIPVALKRKPEYTGSYIEEIVSKSKLIKYFEYFKASNPLYTDVVFTETVLDEIIKEVREDVERQDDWKTYQEWKKSQVTDDENDTQETDDENEDDSDNEGADVNEKPDNSVQEEDYNLPEYLTEVPADTVIDPLTQKENRQSVSELVANAIIEQEKNAKKSKSKKSIRTNDDDNDSSGDDTDNSDIDNDDSDNDNYSSND